MLTVEEALDAILSRIARLSTERVDVMATLGRVLAEPIVSRRRIPPWANSSMDGYAVRAADTRAGRTLTVVGTIVAGSVPERALGAGEAMRIFTGAPLPPGADAVVPQEDVDAVDGHVTLHGAVARDAFVRPAGEDVREGDCVLEPGSVVGPPEVGILATLGYTQVEVSRRPRVAVLSTGSELADLGAEPMPGQIPNSNTYALMAQVTEAGGWPINLGVVPDRLGDIEARVRRALEADVFVSSAGVSVGDLDLVREALTRAGAQLHLWKVSMRPGKPITFGSLGGRPVFGLPGNPVSAMVTFELFVRPALLAMMGRREIHRARVRARAAADIPNPGARRGYLRVTLSRDGGGFQARLTGAQGSGLLRSMVAGDGLAIVAPDTIITAGQDVDVIVFRPLER